MFFFYWSFIFRSGQFSFWTEEPFFSDNFYCSIRRTFWFDEGLFMIWYENICCLFVLQLKNLGKVLQDEIWRQPLFFSTWRITGVSLTGTWRSVTSVSITWTNWTWMSVPWSCYLTSFPVTMVTTDPWPVAGRRALIGRCVCAAGRTEEEYRHQLGGYGITGELATRPVASLSGGQKSRVAFAQMTMPW